MVTGQEDLLVEAVVQTADRMAPNWRKWLWYAIQTAFVVTAGCTSPSSAEPQSSSEASSKVA